MEYFLAIKEEQTTTIWSNIKESQKHHVEWKKPDTKENMLYDVGKIDLYV